MERLDILEAQVLVDRVIQNLKDFGLLTSEEKCSWEVTQVFEWMGWRIDTVEFKIYVLERKLIKAEEKLDQLIVLVGRSIKVKTLSSIVGLLISFGLAVGSPRWKWPRWWRHMAGAPRWLCRWRCSRS